MNTSYNYTDFIGLNLEANHQHEACVDSSISPQAKTTVTGDETAQHKDKIGKDKPVE